MDWPAVATGATIAIAICAGVWAIFRLRESDRDRLFAEIAQIKDRITKVEVKTEEIDKLRKAKHDHANAIQRLVSKINRIENERKRDAN